MHLLMEVKKGSRSWGLERCRDLWWPVVSLKLTVLPFYVVLRSRITLPESRCSTACKPNIYARVEMYTRVVTATRLHVYARVMRLLGSVRRFVMARVSFRGGRLSMITQHTGMCPMAMIIRCVE